MTLSNSWSFTVVRDDIIREAMLNIGAIGEGEVPTAQEVNDCARKLNMMVKSWMGYQDFAPGLKMWERQRGELFLESDRGTYVLGGSNTDHWAGGLRNGAPGVAYNQTTLTLPAVIGDTHFTVKDVSGINIGDTIGIQGSKDLFWATVLTTNPNTKLVGMSSTFTENMNSGAYVFNYTFTAQRPLAIVTCVLRDNFMQDIPMSVMTLQDYEALPTKATSAYIADPTAYYYESQFIDQQFFSPVNTGGGAIYLDTGGAQDITKHLHIVYVRPIMDLNNPGDSPEYPQQWYRALCWGLSKEICGMFDATWTKDMEDNKVEAIAFAKEADSETSTFYFQPYATDPFGV